MVGVGRNGSTGTPSHRVLHVGELSAARRLPFWEEVGMAGMRDEVERHRDELIAAARRHRAHNVRLFGSVATGRDHADSDVDFLVDFEAGATLLDLADLRDEFEEILGRSVDVLSSRGLKPRDEDIRREAVPL